MISSHNPKNSQSETKQSKPNSNQKAFSPCLTNTLSIERDPLYFDGTAKISTYSQKHNMIIASPSDTFIHFFNASTLLPDEGRDKLELKSIVMCMSFCPETDVYIFGCEAREIYAYNALSKKLKKLKQSDSVVLSMVFVSPVYYVLALFGLKGIQVGSLEKSDFTRNYRQNNYSYSLYYLRDSKLLLSGVVNGDMVVCRTDKLPKLRRICSVKIQKETSGLTKLEGARINQREFIITCEYDHGIRIWHMIKGRMRKIKTITSSKRNYSFAYLEEYKMIAVTASGKVSDCVKFISLLSGKLECTLDDKILALARRIFVMKDKNAIGITNSNTTTINIIKLG